MAETTNGPQNPQEPEDAEIERLKQLANDERLDIRNRFQLPDPPKIVRERPDAQPRKVTGNGRMARIMNAVPGATASDASSRRKTALASTVGVTLVASILGGAGLGWVLDKFLFHNPQTPWGMVIGVLLGSVAGFMNVVKITALMQSDKP